MQTEAYEQMVLKVALRSALNQGELTVVYQPQVRVRDHTVIGFEALLRWNSKQYGKISPDVFIPLAEQTGLIHSIGEWVEYFALRIPPVRNRIPPVHGNDTTC